jgi:hypothetical protein
MKTILISLFFAAISACASTKSNESLQLMDGSSLFIHEGKAVRLTNKAGEAVAVKKGAMLELENGNYIYINQDKSVNKINTDNNSHAHDTNSSSSGHSH